MDARVIVVGAGFAGLCAARRLRSLGVATRVLEARDRVGGRALSRPHRGAVFELGAQWVGPTQARLRKLVDELGIALFPQHHRGNKVLDLDGRRSTYRGEIPSAGLLNLVQIELLIRRLDRMAGRVPLGAVHRAHRAEEWDGMTLESLKRDSALGADGRKMFDLAVRTVFGAEPAELSLLFFLFYLNSAGGFRKLVEVDGAAQQDRFVTGASSIAERMAEPLGEELVLSSPVRCIAQDADGVTVTADSGTHRAERVIISVPPHLAGRIRYEPVLPPLHDQLFQRRPMGATVKVLGFYDRAHWRERGLSGEAISSGSTFSAVFDNSSPDGASACLLGFVVGSNARRWTRLGADERRELAAREFGRLFELPPRAMVDYLEQDWSSEPWTGGCPVASFAPGGVTSFADAWRAPVGRLHWAGTETARYWHGFLEGALESGERAASEVLTLL